MKEHMIKIDNVKGQRNKFNIIYYFNNILESDYVRLKNSAIKTPIYTEILTTEKGKMKFMKRINNE